MGASATIPFTTTAPGPFTLAHNLGYIPVTVIFEFTDGGTVWFQPQRYDTENLYLEASDTGITGVAIIWASCADC
jgi:hypothetical protein